MFKVQASGFKVQGVGNWAKGLGVGVQGSRLKAHGLGFTGKADADRTLDLLFGLGFRV